MDRDLIIEYVKEAMLSDPQIEASFSYNIASIAAIDDGMFFLVNKWMELTDSEEKMEIEQDMIESIDDFYLLGKTNIL